MSDLHSHKILIIDFGSQYTQLIARRVREIGVYCELLPYYADPNAIAKFAPNGIILAGGPESVHQPNSPQIPKQVFTQNVPILGICYGMQALAMQLGGNVTAANVHEFGFATIKPTATNNLFADLIGDELSVWMSHGDKVSQLPADCQVIASSDNCEIAAFANEKRQIYGVQFHPEVTHTDKGKEILERFVCNICRCAKNWNTNNIIDYSINQIKQQIGAEQVLLALSGGVDSSVVATLLHKAIGSQLTCVFVDNGLLRLNEGDEVMRMFADNFGIKVIRVNAQTEFLDALTGISDPETKRKIIGHTFIKVFEREANKLQDIKFLAQGTIYPDVIESAAAKSSDGTAHVIKSHHNVGGLPDNMQFELIEPLRELFKDEVRALGLELGIDADMINRHPFPGPGLGVRILGEVKTAYADILRKADAIFITELKAAGWYDKVAQAFAVFLPVKSVGVVGDARRYSYVISLRAVETVDFMTARSARLPYELLETVSRRIINEISDVARVTYDISSKPPATIEWE